MTHEETQNTGAPSATGAMLQREHGKSGVVP